MYINTFLNCKSSLIFNIDKFSDRKVNLVGIAEGVFKLKFLYFTILTKRCN